MSSIKIITYRPEELEGDIVARQYINGTKSTVSILYEGWSYLPPEYQKSIYEARKEFYNQLF